MARDVIGPRHLVPPRTVVEAVGLTRHFGEVVAVDAIDLRVGEGEVVAVLGPNGAGKTTTIEMLLGLRRPTSGSVRVFGGDPTSATVRGRVGAMLQDTDAPDSLTVAEIVDLVAAYYPYRLPTPDVLERASLTGHRKRRVTQLSGGERQRLSFGLAIVGDPDLLYLDEPTASLDVGARRAFWRQVQDFAALGKTILFSTHNLEEADLVADRVVIINRGRIFSDSTPRELKGLLAGRRLELVTDADDAELEALPGVHGVALLPPDAATVVGPGLRRVRLQATEAEPALQALFASGRTVSGLIVTEATLEEAFVHLTSAEVAR
jgi:ABC-2 type transport system ATP-binding protein